MHKYVVFLVLLAMILNYSRFKIHILYLHMLHVSIRLLLSVSSGKQELHTLHVSIILLISDKYKHTVFREVVRYGLVRIYMSIIYVAHLVCTS